MAPSHECLVLLPPGGALIRRIADDARRAVPGDGDALYGAGLRSGQHDLALDVLSKVIAFLRSFADIDEVRGHVGAFAVLRERDRRGVPIRESPHCVSIRVEYPQLGKIGIPGGARSLRSVKDLSVGR